MDGVDIVLEYVSGGSLKGILKKYHGLDERVIKRYSVQLLRGLSYLHENGVIHRDLKSANILIAPDGTIKLTDFGSAKKFGTAKYSFTRSLKGSPYWMAPEVVSKTGHSYPADIWSFGCVLIEMYTGIPPWANKSQNTRQVLAMIE